MLSSAVDRARLRERVVLVGGAVEVRASYGRGDVLVGEGTPCCGAGLKSTSRARVERNRAARKCGEIYGAEHEAHHMAPISSALGEPRGMPGCLVTNNRDRDGYFDYASTRS